MSEAPGLVHKSVWLLRAVAQHADGVGLSELARQTGVPKATCYRIITALVGEDCLTFDPVSRRYHLSIGLMGIVAGLMGGDGWYSQVKEVLGRLVQVTGETAGFDVLQPPHVVVLAQVVSDSLIGQTAKPVPRLQPPLETASGRAMLATWTEPDIRKVFLSTEHEGEKSGQLPWGGQGSEDIERLGYAVSVDGLERGATSVAAAIPAPGHHTYGVWIGGPSFRLQGQALELAADAVKDAARALGPVIGSVPGSVPGLSSANTES